jgi:hypothetical protein
MSRQVSYPSRMADIVASEHSFSSNKSRRRKNQGEGQEKNEVRNRRTPQGTTRLLPIATRPKKIYKATNGRKRYRESENHTHSSLRPLLMDTSS